MQQTSLRRIITIAKNLIRRQGFDRRRAIRAAIKIAQRTPVNTRRVEYDTAAALEYLQHRNRSMSLRRVH